MAGRVLLLGAVAAVLLPEAAGYLKTSAEDLAKNPGYSFEDYVREYGKTYEGEEYERRRGIFAENLGRIRAHNAEAGATSRAGLNEFTDWTVEEFKARRTGLKKGELFARRGLLGRARAVYAGELPKAVDWREKGVVTAVKNQGGCGSCWAFSATETVESAVAIATGKLLELSPQQLVSCAPNPQHCGGTGGCDGSTQPLAFNYTIRAGGMSLETEYPYQGVTGKCDPSKVKPVAGIRGQVDLPTNDQQALLTAVATVGPIAISVDAGSIGWQLYEGGVLTKGCGADIDHAVQLVGYGETEEKVGYWIVRNSWGASWGEKGYIRIHRDLTGKPPCATDKKPADGFGCQGGPSEIQVCGMCGILSGSSYPTGAFAL